MPNRQAQPDALNRARFLDDACGGVPALRLEVESLLAAHLEADNFLNGISAAMAVRLLA